jgi:hypothetical protein
VGTWHASHLSDDGGTCGGFATSVWQTVPGGDPAVPMGYWTQADLPFYYGLAGIFPVADRWFCSCLGPTFPNRRFLISGTAHGLIDDLPWDLVDYRRRKSAQRSPIMMVGALVLPEVTAGMTEASATRRPSTPYTRRSAGLTTAAWSMPILHVPTWWW